MEGESYFNATMVNSTLVNHQPLERHELWEVITIAAVTAVVSLVTIVGNVLVIISFKINSQLKTVNNYYLLSLACADLIIGVFSMNLYTTYILMGRWALGSLACDLWLALDYVASNASVMNLLVISFDRYFSITRPLTYRAKRTPKRAGIMIGLAWLISFILWAPAILCWQYLVGKRTVPPDECQIQFLSEPTITFGTAIAAFYIPVSVMTILYSQTEKNNCDTPKYFLPPAAANKLKSQKCVAYKFRLVVKADGTQEANNGCRKVKIMPCSFPMSKDPSTKGLDPNLSHQMTKRKRMVLVKERKAAQTLSAILLAFIITWTPYNIMVLVSTFCDKCVPVTLWHLGYWLCYVNSTVNPICYALCNRTFRKTFKMLLLCRWKKKKMEEKLYWQGNSKLP
uniref:Muscarinic acetylcholine receptor n=1 Tax=Ictidomys tridecemlineatus TaxID=43179 RepID=I3MZV6_ICTTR